MWTCIFKGGMASILSEDEDLFHSNILEKVTGQSFTQWNNCYRGSYAGRLLQTT